MVTFSLMSGLCPLILIMAVGTSEMSSPSALFQRRPRRTVSNFPFSKLQGEWYDAGRTTFIWGAETWTSQQWNFVQGNDGTMVALFNGMCKACGGCSESIVYKVTLRAESGAGFLLHGKGETLSLTVQSDLQSQIVVSICFAEGARSLRRCPMSKLQVSVLSRQPEMKVDRWTSIIRHLPVSIDEMDTRTGEGCPKLFIDPKLVTADLVSSMDTQVQSLVGFSSRRSSLVLPCSLGPHVSSHQYNTLVIWRREQADVLLSKNSTVLKRANGARLLHRAEGQFDLLLRGVSRGEVDVYTCYLEHLGQNGRRLLLSRVAVSSGDFPARPTIVYHSQTVRTRQGENVVLECYANGHPALLLTWWIRSTGAPEAYVRKGKGGNKLRIRNVQASDEGIYKCEASSRMGAPVSAFISLQVGFPPETEVHERSVSVLFRGQVTLTCQVKIKSPDTLLWRKGGADVEPDHRRSVSLIQRSEYVFELRLRIQEMRKEDFGHYKCFARDQHGVSISTVDVQEQTYDSERCLVSRIPVMKNFDVQRFLGDMENVESTQPVAGNQTSMSEVRGFFITLSGSLVLYSRGFSPAKQHCMDPEALSLVRLDTPSDYVFSLNGQRVQHKIVYTDYTHAVTYTCISGNDQQQCPGHLARVQILSRHSHVPDDVLQTLYGYVQQMCIPVTSLVEMVPGICQMPADFMYKKGWIGRYPVPQSASPSTRTGFGSTKANSCAGPNCQVANLQTQGNLTAGHLTGKWQLIGEVRPEDYTALARTSLHIVAFRDRLIRLYRSVESGMCTATEADVLYKSATNGSYYYDYKGRTVDSKILLVDGASLVLYTCLALRHDGTCYPGSELVELYHRHDSIDDRAMLWLIRAVSSACVDIKRLVRTSVAEDCVVPERVVTAAKSGMVNGASGEFTLVIPQYAAFFRDLRSADLEGHWMVMARNVESLPGSAAIGQFSQSYQVIQRREGRLTLMVRHYESEWGLCPPTRVLQLSQRSGFGDYILVPHANSVLFNILSVSEDAVVVYWCRGIGSDGVCRPESLTVEILKRSTHTLVSEERLRTMMQSAVDVCVKLENMQYTSQVEKCTVTDTVVDLVEKGQITSGVVPVIASFSCSVSNDEEVGHQLLRTDQFQILQLKVLDPKAFDIPVLTCQDKLIVGQQKLDVEKLTGRWTVLWRNKEFWAMRSPFAESSYLIPTHYGLLYLWRSWNNDLDRCGPEEAGRFITTSGPGDYYSGFDGVPVAMKILNLTSDGGAMLAMWCHLDDDSRCHPHRTTIEILSRDASLDNDTRDALFRSVDLACVSTPEWVSSEPDMCHVENDVLTTAYIEGLDNVEYSKIGCRVDLIEGQTGVTEDLIMGSWISVYQSNLSESNGPAAVTELHFTKTREGPISLLYRLYSADKEECLPARIVELTRDGRKLGAIFQLKYCESKDPYGYLYVLYADEQHLAVLLCVDVLSDGMCDPRTQNLVLLQRGGGVSEEGVREVNETLLDTVRGLGADACVDPHTLVMPTLDPCPVPEPILTDASRGQFNACSESGNKVQCYPRYIPVHPAFDINDLSGTWYTVGHALLEDQVRGKLQESATYHFVSSGSGPVTMLYTPGGSETCQPTEMRLLRAAGDGQFYFTINNTQEPYPVPETGDFQGINSEYQIGVLKVVWMEENLALTYWCFDAGTAQPWCPSPQVALLSRQPATGNDRQLPAELRARVVNLCVSSEDFVTVDSGSCVIPGDIIAAVEEDNFAIAASFSVIQCAQQFVPVVADFSMDQFSGVWHTIRQTHFMWGNATRQSLIRSYVVRDNGTAIMAFTGHPVDKEHCMPMDVRMLTLSNLTSGQWTYTEGSETATVKVVWTDYTTAALLYTCKGQVGGDGRCPRSSLQVELLSRSPVMTPEVMEVMLRQLPSLCVEEEEVQVVTTGQCQITEELEHLVEGASRGGGEDLVTLCRVQDIPLEKNFTLQQMRGTWFEVARTRFTFNTMESIISVYEYNPEQDQLDGLFIGTLHKQCQSPLQSVTRKKFAEGPDSIIEGRIQVGESIFPWITFNILYYDGDMLMHMACYGESDDGTCPRDKTEVAVLGRSRQLTKSLEAKLDGLMQNVCLTRADLVPTKETADCLPKLLTGEEDMTGLPDSSSCNLEDVAVVDNLNEADLLGVWYGLGSVDYSSAEDPSGFVVSIRRSNDHTLQWRQWNIRNGSCPGDKAVYMKAACSGSQRGDYFSTRASSFMLQWTVLKILRQQGELMLIYSCTRETYEGTCEPEGIRVDLLGRSTAAAMDDIIPLLDALPSVCLKPELMKAVVSTTECDALAMESVAMVKTSACAVDALPVIQADGQKISGLWYEVARTVDKMFPMTKGVIVYQTLPGGQLSMYFAAMDPRGQCQGPMQGVMRQRCPGNPGPETMSRLKFPGIWSWAPWRVLHADYNSSLIALSCMDEQQDGSCSLHGLKIHFLSRDPKPDDDLRPRMYTILKALNCFEDVTMEDVYHEGPSCKHKLEPLLASGA